MELFDYIVAVYFGKRRSKMYSREIEANPFIFVEEHFKFLSENQSKVSGLSEVFFVCNLHNKEEQLPVVQSWFDNIQSKYQIEVGVNVIYRENENFSYGAWNEALTQITQEETLSKYAFLIEDDYVPCTPDFCLPYISKIEEDSSYGFVASLANVHKSSKKYHAAISNGLVSYSSVRQACEEFNSPFALKSPKIGGYGLGEHLQVNFLKHITHTHKLTDISSEYSIPFYDVRKGLKFYGKPGGVFLIRPVGSNNIRPKNK